MSELKTYSKNELERFDNLIQKFYVGCADNSRFLDLRKLQIAYGSIDSKGAIILTNIVREKGKNGETKFYYDKPTRQEQFENLMNQYYWFKDKEDWVQKKQSESFQKIEEQIITDEFDNW